MAKPNAGTKPVDSARTHKRNQQLLKQIVFETLESRVLLTAAVWNNLSSSSATWDNAANWNPGSSFPNSSGDSANLNIDLSVDQSVSLGQSVVVNALTLGDSAATGGSGQTETIGAGNTITFDNGSATASLSLAGNAVGDATVAAALSLNSDLVISNDSGQTLTISGDIQMNGHVVTVSGTGAVVLSGSVNHGKLVKRGDGILTLSGSSDNGFLNFDAEAGTTVLAKSSDAGTHAAGDVSNIAAGATVRLAGSGGDQIYDGFGVNLSGGTLDLAGQSEWIDTLNGYGVVTNSSAASSSVTLGASGGSSNFSGTIEGALSLGKVGGGSVTLAGDNTYTGGTSVSGGTLVVGSLSDSGVSNIGRTGAINLSGGTLLYTGPSTTTSRAVNLSGISGVDVQSSSATLALAGPVAGNGVVGLVKTGAGALDLSGTADNSYLVLDAEAGLTYLDKASTGAVHAVAGISNIALGAIVQVAGTGGDQIFNDWVSGPFGVNLGGGTLDLSGNSEGIDFLTGSGSITNSASGPAAFTVGVASGSSSFGGTLSDGSGGLSLVKTGEGTLRLGGSNTYTGGTTVQQGELTIALLSDGGPSNLGPSGPLSLSGGSLTYTGASTATSRPVQLANNSALNVQGPATTLVLSGAVAGVATAGLSKQGPGTLDLSGTSDNAYMVLDAEAGVTLLDKSSNASVHSVAGISNIALGATVRIAGTGSDQIYDDWITGPFGVNLGGGTLDLNGQNEGIDFLTSASSWSVIKNSASQASTLTIGHSGGSGTFDGLIENGNGAVSLDKVGGGTLTLSNDQSYTGGTNVDGGVLAIEGTLAGTITTTGSGGVSLAAGIQAVVNGKTITDTDVNAPAVDGSGSFFGSTRTVSGGGAGIGGSSDQFNFANQTFSGDGSIIAQITSVTGGGTSAAAGVMFRNDVSGNAAFASVLLIPGQGIGFAWRPSIGAAGQTTLASAVGSAQWVKVVRSGSNFSGFYSADGQSWAQIGATQAVSMGANAAAGLAVTAHDDSKQSVAAFSNFSLLPVGWSDLDIGAPALAGSGTFDGTTWQVSGGGADIWNSSDQFNFVNQAFSGDGSITAKVSSIASTDQWAKAGVMLRGDSSSGAAFADVVVTPGQGVDFQWRSTAGGLCSYSQATGVSAPAWVRLVRAGQSISGFYSVDGIAWNQIGSSQVLPLSSSILAGLAVSAHNNSLRTTAQFGNVSVTAAGLPAGWADGDIGSPSVAGGARYDGSGWTVSGGGADIWNTSDQFNFTREPLSGDGSVVAEVTSLTNTDPWAKAGVMFRSDASASAALAAVVVTPGQGVNFQWRGTAGGDSSNIQVQGIAAPIWIKLTRAGTLLSGFYSTDRSTWTQIGSAQSVALPSTALAGLAVTAHNDASLNTATFANVAVLPSRSAPTAAQGPSAVVDPIHGATAALSVLGADDGGESALTYTWASVGTPPAAVTYSINDSNAAKQTTVSFSAAGHYDFNVTIADDTGLSNVFPVGVDVVQKLSNLSVTPQLSDIPSSSTQQLAATFVDQFGNAMPTQPAVSWSVTSGLGSVSPSGLFTAGSTSGVATVMATGLGQTGTSSVRVGYAAPTVATPAAAGTTTLTTASTTLSVLGASAAGESGLTYTWSTLTMPASVGNPQFQTNGTNAAKNTTVTLHAAGAYTFRVLISDGVSSVTSLVSLNAVAVLSGLAISPHQINVVAGTRLQYNNVAFDQFGNNVSLQSAWSSNAPRGVYTAPMQVGHTDTVTVTGGGFTDSSAVTVVAATTNLTLVSNDFAVQIQPNVDTTVPLGEIFKDDATSASDFTATIDWGDGSTSSPNVNPWANYPGSGPKHYVLRDDHSYAANGTYTVNITVTDSGGQSATTVDQITVGPPPLYQVPGTPGTLTKLTITRNGGLSDAYYNNQLGIFQATDAQGSVGGLSPGDADYAAAALTSSSTQPALRTYSPPGTAYQVDAPAGSYLGLLVVQNTLLTDAVARNPNDVIPGDPLTFFTNPVVNPDVHFAHFKKTVLSNGSVVFDYGVEDLSYGGDDSYNDITFTVSSVAPPVLTSTADNANHTVHLNWTAALGAASYSVERSLDGQKWGMLGSVTGGLQTFDDSTASPGTTYSYRIISTDSSGQSGDASNTASASLTAAPLTLAAQAISFSEIDLSWSSGSANTTSYNLYRSAASDFTPSAQNQIASAITGTTYHDAGLSASTTWYYQVTALNAAGLESTASNVASATTLAASGSVSGTVWSDTNQNGSRDSYEAGLSGWRIYVDLNNDGQYQSNEPTALTGADGTYTVSGVPSGSYTLRLVAQTGYQESHPTSGNYSVTVLSGQTTINQDFGVYVPHAPVITSTPSPSYSLPGTPDPSTGAVSPANGITATFSDPSQTQTQTVSVTVPAAHIPVPAVDVFLLLDNTGSMSQTAPNVEANFPQVIATLEHSFPNVNFAFGVGKFEDFNDGTPTDRPFTLDQPIVATSTPGFTTAITSALLPARRPAGGGGDAPESNIEALYQVATGAGIDGNGNGSKLESGSAGAFQTQNNPGGTGDVPPFSSFVADPSNNILPPSGTLGGVGFRSGAEHIILDATDAGTAFNPGPLSAQTIDGTGGSSVPLSAFEGQVYRASTPPGGATIQNTVNALNALDAKVIGLGDEHYSNALQAGAQPRGFLEALATLTGSINRSAQPIDRAATSNGYGGSTPSTDQILPGDPLYFLIDSNNNNSLAHGIISGVSSAVANGTYDVNVLASDPAVHIVNPGGVASAIQQGQPVSFNVTIDGTAGSRTFNLIFVQNGTGDVLGSIPVTVTVPYIYPLSATETGGYAPYSFSVLSATRVSDGTAIPSSSYQIQQGLGQTNFIWHPTDAGTYQFSIIATDSATPVNVSQPQTFTVTVGAQGAGHTAPVFTSVPDQKAIVSQPYTLALQATDPQSSPLKYYLYGAPEGMTIDSSTGLISWTAPQSAIGAYQLTATAVDGVGLEASTSFKIVVALAATPNRPPVVVSTPLTAAVVGRLYGYDVTAVDPDSDVVSFSQATDSQGLPVPLPAGMTLDPATGSISWIATADEVGAHLVSLDVKDSQGAVVPYSYTVNVAPAPVTAVAAVALSSSQIDVTWAASAGASSYSVYRSTTSVFSPAPGNKIATVSGIAYSDTALTSGTTYYYTVRANDSSGDVSDDSPEANATTSGDNPATAPSTPVSFSGTFVATSSVVLRWSLNPESDIAGYNVYRDSPGQGWQVISTQPVTGTSFTDSNPLFGATDHYALTAVTTAAVESNPAFANVSVPGIGPSISFIAANPTVVSGTGTNLQALATEFGSVDPLTYTWSATGGPAAVDFGSQNGTAQATALPVTFHAAGNYSFDLVVKDSDNRRDERSINVIVRQTLSSLTVSPTAFQIQSGTSGTFTANAFDQFGAVMATPQGVAWALVSNGSGATLDSATGAYTSGSSSGTDLIKATVLSHEGTASVNVVSASSAGPVVTSILQSAANATSVTLDVTATDPAGEAGLTYAWAVVAQPTGAPAPVLPGNGTHGARHEVITFRAVGDYQISLVATNGSNESSPPVVFKLSILPLGQINLSPGSASATPGNAVQFAAQIVDQFGATISGATASWSIVTNNTGGTISSTGRYVAGSEPGVDAVQATYGNASASADVAVATAPAQPQHLTAIPISTSQIELQWDTIPGAYRYVITRTNPDGSTTILPAPDQSTSSDPYFDQSLSLGTTYSYTVQTADPFGNLSAPSASVSVATLGAPAQPTGLAASALSGTQVHLAWTDPHDPQVQGWDVLRSLSQNGPFSSILPAGSESATTEYDDQTAAPSTQYWYQVVAINQTQDRSPASLAVSVTTLLSAGTPIAPTNLQAGYAGQASTTSGGPGRIGLTWSAAPGVGSLGFDVFRSPTPSFVTSAATLIGSSSSNFYVDDVAVTSTNSPTYYYVVKAVSQDDHGNEVSSAASNVASVATTPPATGPAAPSNLQATSISTDHVTLSWIDNSLTETEFDIYRRAHGATAWGAAVGRVTADQTTFTDTSIVPSSDYDYMVAAHNEAGDGYSAPAEAITPSAGPKPGAPTVSLDSASTTYSQIGLQWSAVTTPAGISVAGYRVYRRIHGSSDPFALLTSALTTGISYVDTNLSPGTYDYQVRAVSSVNSPSDPGELDNVSTTTAPANLPPVVSITAPAAFAGFNYNFNTGTQTDGRLQTLTAVTGSVDDANGDLASWSLVLRPVDRAANASAVDIPLAHGTTPAGVERNPDGSLVHPNGDLLFTLDPTQYRNGDYELILTATDAAGNLAAPSIVKVSLFSQAKLGNFTLPVNDLTFNVPGGQPITVNRLYDSQNANTRGDFGYGWTLQASGTDLSTTARPGSGSRGSGNTLRPGDIVYITLPGGGQHAFQFWPIPNNYQPGNAAGVDPYGLGVYTDYYVQFVCVDGSNATLTIPRDVHDPNVANRIDLQYDRVNNEFFNAETGNEFDPSLAELGNQYQVKTADGSSYAVNATTGQLESSVDPNGNTTTYSANSISENGYQLKIVRGGPAGAISSIYLADASGTQVGNAITYGYDAATGNLTSVTDRAGNTTRYAYDTTDPSRTHYLTQVINPQAVAALTAGYTPRTSSPP